MFIFGNYRLESGDDCCFLCKLFRCDGVSLAHLSLGGFHEGREMNSHNEVPFPTSLPLTI